MERPVSRDGALTGVLLNWRLSCRDLKDIMREADLRATAIVFSIRYLIRPVSCGFGIVTDREHTKEDTKYETR